MDSTKLVEWLIEEKHMSTRSAKDVISRCGRVYRMLDVDMINVKTIEDLQQNEQFKESSMFIKSQLKRTMALCLEFMSKSERNE